MTLPLTLASVLVVAVTSLLSLSTSVSAAGSAAAASASSASVLVDVSQSRHPVSEAIFGTNFFGGLTSSPAFTSGWVKSTRMGGGDPTTVYNWRIDADNAGFDWYFQQRPRAATANNSADYFVSSSIAAGALAVVDISTIGHVAAGRENCYSFPVSTFPNQQRSLGDMGNGLFPNGTTLGSVYGQQLHCYVESVPADGADFVGHLRQLMGADTFEQSAVVQLDNEPEWWDQQHQDVHPQPFTYDEVWNMTRSWAGAIKAKYPKVKVMGGVAGGWWGTWCSALDGGGWHCPNTPGPDYRSHNNTYYWPWLLQQINAYKLQHGVCLIDYIDHHWYPYLNGANSETDPHVQSQLLDQPRSLYDPMFADPAGNSNPITGAKGPAVIRQVHSWLKQYAPDCPNIGIAITEYAFGGAKLHTTALALAEVFSILARERVSLATLFQIPTLDTAIYHSFELYNYNGNHITGDSVHAESSADVQLLTAYAQHDSDTGALYIKLFNKHNTTTVTVDVSVQGIPAGNISAPGTADVWQLLAAVDQPVGVSQLQPVKVSWNGTQSLSLTAECAPRTATVVKVSGLKAAASASSRLSALRGLAKTE